MALLNEDCVTAVLGQLRSNCKVWQCAAVCRRWLRAAQRELSRRGARLNLSEIAWEDFHVYKWCQVLGLGQMCPHPVGLRHWTVRDLRVQVQSLEWQKYLPVTTTRLEILAPEVYDGSHQFSFVGCTQLRSLSLIGELARPEWGIPAEDGTLSALRHLHCETDFDGRLLAHLPALETLNVGRLKGALSANWVGRLTLMWAFQVEDDLAIDYMTRLESLSVRFPRDDHLPTWPANLTYLAWLPLSRVPCLAHPSLRALKVRGPTPLETPLLRELTVESWNGAPLFLPEGLVSLRLEGTGRGIVIPRLDLRCCTALKRLELTWIELTELLFNPLDYIKLWHTTCPVLPQAFAAELWGHIGPCPFPAPRVLQLYRPHLATIPEGIQALYYLDSPQEWRAPCSCRILTASTLPSNLADLHLLEHFHLISDTAQIQNLREELRRLVPSHVCTSAARCLLGWDDL